MSASGRLWEVDLHSHTRASPDCLSDPVEVVRRARQAGLDRLAVTDHDEIRGAFEAREADPDLVIVGEEVRTEEGLDLIGLFLRERIRPGRPFRDVADAIHAQGGITCAAHPLDPLRGTDEPFLDEHVDCIDVVEVLNGRTRPGGANRRAAEWAARHGLPAGAGSDAHLLSEIGRARVRLPPFGTPGEFLASLARGEIVGRTSPPWVHLGSTLARLRKRLR